VQADVFSKGRASANSTDQHDNAGDARHRKEHEQMATEPNGIAALLTKLKSGQRFELSPAEQQIIVDAMERAAAAPVAADDPPTFPGRPNPPKRTPAGETLFKTGESAREQGGPGAEAMDDDDKTDLINEIHAMLRDNAVPEEIITTCMNKLRDWAQGAPPGMNKHAVLKDGKIETHIIGDAALRPFRDLFANLPRVHSMGSPVPDPRSRPVSAAAAALVATALPSVVRLRRV
jgi:hypothetical protein